MTNTPNPSPRVLVVDDDSGIRETISDILAVEGWQVMTATNGEAGLTAARALVPDLIISDIMMPGTDGLSMLAQLRKDAALAHVPVIFLTARVGPTDLRKGMEHGADDYLMKPFDPSELLRAARTRLDRRRASEAGLVHFRQSVARMLPHELRTPLVGVMGFSDLLIEEARAAGEGGTVPAATVQHFAQQILTSGRRLLHLVERYVLWIDLHSNAQELSSYSAHWKYPASLLTSEDRARVVAVEHGRGADLLIDLEQALLAAPPDLLPRVISELVDNAYKFSPPGTMVRMTGRREGTSYCLSVEDEGRGLPEGAAHRIDAFVQFDRERWEQQGTGLGLAIAQRFAALIGGSLSIANRVPAPGARVELIIPLVQDPTL